ncbi:siroheme synthase CysG [Agaribacterium haliotis]|uniref:siroheme synthase CysG n=1 Tax=Agaribacterium haliotis TaxID=2013869 RepID=UPI000BB5633B|nr:siroheme synthase CysG [Agaribacterium haliotis]
MDYFPLFFKLDGRKALLVGGGDVALRKARLLCRAGAQVDLLAEQSLPEVTALCKQSGGQLLVQPWSEAAVNLNEYVLVVAATDDEAVNQELSVLCQQRNLPVNVVDNPELCTVITPAIIDRSPLMIAVASGGQAPVLARKVKSLIETLIPGSYGKLAQFAAGFRDRIKQGVPDMELRRRFWENCLTGDIAEKVLAGNEEQAEQQLLADLAQQKVERGGEVYLVGAGPGDPDLLTFKALRLMQKAEVVLYDRLVTQPILDMVRKDADFIYVGKQRAEHAVPQKRINEMLLEYAQQGKRVLRLKGGDPFIFGRGAEEIELLSEHNVAFQVVPGITAASGCASYAGIPLTHRDFSQSVRFITGHVKDGVLDFRWKEFVEDSQTLVFYMGLTGLAQICSKLIEHGKDAQTPAALVERGTQPDQRVHLGCLENLQQIVEEKEVHAPTLLIIGGVVSLANKLAWYQSSAE